MEDSRSYLFVTFEGGGNVPPLLALVRRLVSRGHSVRVLADPCLRAPAEAAGAVHIAFTRHFTRAVRSEDLMGDWRAITPLGALRRTFDRVVFGPAAIVAEETRRALDADRPEVVVVDVMMPGALIAAEAAGIPRVVVFHMPEYLPGPGRPAAGPGFLPRSDLIGRIRDRLFTGVFHRQLAGQLAPYNVARRAAGLAPLATASELLAEYHRADRRLILTSRAFDFPITPPPPNVRYVGPVLDEPDWAGDWEDPWTAEDSRPLVVASLSSTFQDQRSLLQRIVRAMGELEVRGLVTLGPSMASERLDLPVNVRAVAAAPHGSLFRRASVVVTHAGHGTVMRSLVSGVPLLCLPMGRDQDDNAARVVARGAGIRLGRTARPARIAAAIRRLIDEPQYTENACRLGDLIRGEMEFDRAIEELETVGTGVVGHPV